MALLSDEKIGEAWRPLDGWAREGEAITKDFERDDSPARWASSTTSPPVAEEMGHHPGPGDFVGHGHGDDLAPTPRVA